MSIIINQNDSLYKSDKTNTNISTIFPILFLIDVQYVVHHKYRIYLSKYNGSHLINILGIITS